MMTMLATDLTFCSNGGAKVTWNNKDRVGFYTVSGSRIMMTMKSINSLDAHIATVTGNGWYMTTNTHYYGYYPYNSDYFNNYNVMTDLPVSYSGQMQITNKDLSHLAAFDYMVTQATTTAAGANFTFAHYGSIIRLACYVPTQMTFNSIVIKSKTNENIFSTTASMNVVNQSITTTATAPTATLTLDKITVEAGDSLIAYIMTAPTDLTGKPLQLSINATDGSALQTYIAGVNIQAGKVYPVSVGNENYFRIKNDNSGADEDTNEVLSLQLDIEDSQPTANQITTATAYAPDFTLDTENKLTPFLLGDVNLDGTVDVTDVVIVVNHFQNDTTDELDFNVADIDGDGVIDVTDVVGIVNIYQRK